MPPQLPVLQTYKLAHSEHWRQSFLKPYLFPRPQLFCSSKLGTCVEKGVTAADFFLDVATKLPIRACTSLFLLMWLLEEENWSYSTCSPTSKEGLVPSHSLPVALWILHSSLHSEAFSPDTIVNTRESTYSTPAYYLKILFWVAWAVVFHSFQVQGCWEPSSSVSWRRAQISWSLQYIHTRQCGYLRHNIYMLSLFPYLYMYMCVCINCVNLYM